MNFLRGLLTVNVMIESMHTVPYVELELALDQAGYEFAVRGSTLVTRKAGTFRPLKPGELERFTRDWYFDNKMAHRWRADVADAMVAWLRAGAEVLPSNAVVKV